MSKPKIKVVIGANYGDEGKGLATDYFTQQAKGPILNVLYNGGPQRGHTVEHKNGLRHIFHHFGSGFFSGASTYFDENFLVDPIKFNIEHCELLDQARYFTDMTEEEAIENSICFCHPNCRVITPWDAMANQILQKSHNTCGCGIWQTIQRYNLMPDCKVFKGMCEMSDQKLVNYLKSVAWFTLFSFKKDDDLKLPEEYQALWFSEQLIDNFIYDIRQMASRVIFASFQGIAEGNDTIIFEGGQGLGLNGTTCLSDRANYHACKNLTPSDTGSRIPISLCKDIADDIEICYVTRTYVTRHGDGPLPYECKKEDVTQDHDITNQPNEFQGKLRYGQFNWDNINCRIDNDFSISKQIDSRCKGSIMFTHVNNVVVKNQSTLEKCDSWYISKSRYSEEVEVLHS